MVDHVDGVLQPELGLLHDLLADRPPRARQEGRRQAEGEAERVERGRVVDEHEEAARDAQDDGREPAVLKGSKLTRYYAGEKSLLNLLRRMKGGIEADLGPLEMKRAVI